jgi:hypothetical protein
MPVNWWAIIVAAVVKFLIGAGWYAPPVFGKQWQQLAGISPEQVQSGFAAAIVVQIIGDLIMAYILARFINAYGAMDMFSGALVGGMAWLAFIATIMVGSIFYERKPPMLIAINAGYQLVGLVVMGAILGAWH